jgi:ribosome-associated translation inhibitor RaiA
MRLVGLPGKHASTTNRRLTMNGRRLLFGKPRPDTHRGWLAGHGSHAAAAVSKVEVAPDAAAPEFPFALMIDPDVPERAQKKAVDVLVHVARFAPRPIVYARMTIGTERDRSARRPVTASASLDVSGRIVTAHAIADTPLNALDLLERRLRRSLDRLDAQWRARRRKAVAAVDADERADNRRRP